MTLLSATNRDCKEARIHETRRWCDSASHHGSPLGESDLDDDGTAVVDGSSRSSGCEKFKQYNIINSYLRSYL
ncbi:hypothetical protein E2C01_042651 [Portunus trituberculatus]|uniref:Uncharacterized protein n=1 Tax=Portunus trituberculatus TaxID=210409 RepID=A0A5B7FU49_PORTR|nr:hypothetical protein [Portunus trituberculatus]